MKRHSVLTLGLLAACLGIGGTGCGDDAKPAKKKAASTAGTGSGGRTSSGGTTSTAGKSALGGTTSTGGTGGTGTGGIANLAGTAGDSAIAGGAGSPMAGSGGAGGMCDVLALQTFARSDTAETWDDNDFSDVIISSGCPTYADVTWPHEEGWQDADPADANHESIHFTLDSYYSTDLTNKQLNLTIELTQDMQGPNGARGAYIVSLVSVSTWDKVIVVEAGGAPGVGGMDAGGMSGIGGITGMAGSAGAGGRTGAAGSAGVTGMGYAGSAGVTGMGMAGAAGSPLAGGGGMSGGAGMDGGYGGQMTTTERHYSEAISPDLEQRTLYRVGDRANLTFKLPNKTALEDSFDPTTVIKVNIRIHTMFFAPEDETGAAGASGAGGEAGGDAMPPAAPVYDYVSSQFAITNFTVTDATP